jgi:hypothetical protein
MTNFAHTNGRIYLRIPDCTDCCMHMCCQYMCGRQKSLSQLVAARCHLLQYQNKSSTCHFSFVTMAP